MASSIPMSNTSNRIAQSGITNRTVTTYETVSGVVWRVTTATRLTATSAKVVHVTKERLTGLSDACRGEVVAIDASGRETVVRKVFDPASNAVVTVTTVDGAETKVDRTSYGLLLSSSSIDGSEEYEYDALGHVASVSTFAVGSDVLRSRRVFSHDVSGNIVDTVTDYGAEGTAIASSVFDTLGRQVSSADQSARTVETGYDGMGRTVSVDGDTHPLMFGYDSAGRKTQGLTTRDGGETWDATTWIYDPQSSLNTSKRYAEGSQISYAYTDNGRKTRTIWARGVWKQNTYDADNRISSVAYSDGTPAVAYSYTDAGKVSEAAVAGGAQYVYGYDSRLLCTNESVTLGANHVDVVRAYDDRSRCDNFAVEVTNVAHAVKTSRFDAYGRVVGYGVTNACGRGIAVALQYTGSRVDGISYTLPNGGTFTSSFTRSPSRPDLITRRDYRFGSGSIYWNETGYDLAGRPTNATDSVSLARTYLYNRRSELAAAQIGTNSYGYAYDSIGNRIWSSANSYTNSYAANCLNQYSAVNRTIDQSEQSNNFTYDADGNLAQDDRFAYAYDAENRLISVVPRIPVEGSFAVENRYNHKNLRVRKIVRRYTDGGWTDYATYDFTYDGGNIVLERITFADGSTRTVEYFWGNDLSGTEQGAGGVGGLVAVSIDGLFFIPCYDHNGNIVCYVSEFGTIAAQYVYDPYGNVIEAIGPNVDLFSFGFSTKYHDREVGLIGYQRRFYCPCYGRWLNRDPIEERGGENLYAFCANNPSGRFDIYGQIDWDTCLSGFFQTASGVFLGATAITSLVGSGASAAPISVPLLAWASLSVANGIRTLSAGLSDRGSPEVLQVIAVQWTYTSITGKQMSNAGVTLTRFCYLAVDITCTCYSIHTTWSSYFKSREVFIPAYGSEVVHQTSQGVRVLEASSQMHFVGSKIGVATQSGSMAIDFKSLYEDVIYVGSEAEEVFINPDVGFGRTE